MDRTLHLSPTVYWHRVADQFLFYHNVHIGRGIIASASVTASQPGLEGVGTPYFFGNSEKEKEKRFEEIRQRDFPSVAPRLKALFLFDDPDVAERGRERWWPDQPFMLHECRIVIPALTHRADSAWLDCREDQWDEYATSYWRGDMSADPFPEVLLHGYLYFPDWASFPKP